MKTPQVALSWSLVLVFVLVAVIGSNLCWHWGMGMFIAWLIFLATIIGITLSESVYLLRPDIMVMASFLGNAYEVYSPLPGRNNGYFGGIVIIFPPVLAQGQILPITGFSMPFSTNAANTKKKGGEPITPVTVFVELTLRLPNEIKGLRTFVQAIPVIQRHWNLTHPEKVEFFDRINSETGKPEFVKRSGPCIAPLITEALAGTVNEAVSRAIADYPFSDVIVNRHKIELAVQRHLAGFVKIGEEPSETIVNQARIFFVSDKNTDHVDSDMGLADLNIADAIPSDHTTALALSAEKRAILISNARTKEGDGEAQYLLKVSAQVGTPAGMAALSSTTLLGLKTNVTVVAAPDMLTAALGKALVNTAPVATPPNPGTP